MWDWVLPKKNADACLLENMGKEHVVMMTIFQYCFE